MKQPCVSVILPVWGVEAYISRSFASLLDQSYDNIEYIVVDDCTSDRSIDIIQSMLDEYDNRSNSVRIVKHDRNRGLAAARNTGLQAASGEFLLFLDSDDYFEKTYVADMIEYARSKSCDIVICDYFISYVEHDFYKSQQFNGDGKGLCSEILLGRLQSFTWNKLIKRSLFVDNNITFIEGVNMWEDVSVIPRVAFFASKVCHIPKAYVHYNQRNQNSYSTNRIPVKSLYNIRSVVDCLSNFYAEHPLDKADDLMSVFKLRAKFYYLVNSKGALRKEFNSLYPETKLYCFKKRLHPIYSNVIHVAAFLNLYFLIDWIWFLINKIKQVYYGK